MELLPGTVPTLVRILLQTLGLSAVFVLAGQPLVRKLLPDDCGRPWSLSFRYGSGFFLGLSAFLVSFVALSRAASSARAGLWISLALLAGAGLVDLLAGKGPRQPLRSHALLVAVLLVLFASFVVTTATLWLEPCPSGPSPVPTQLAEFGCMHSGRYAKYSVHVAEHDRIPFVPQNMGQSLLAAVHLLLGSDAPLAALMVWLPCVLAGLACLVFGFLRSAGLTAVWSLGGTFFVLFCNIALSLVSAVVLDCGSPLGFGGYTDVTLGAATLLLAAVAVRGALVEPEPRTRWALALPALLGLVWCWYGPQNVVVAVLAVAGAGLLWVRSRPADRLLVLRRLGATAAVFGLAVVAGGLQLGTFMPQGMREDIGEDVSPLGSKLRFRPYVQYVTTNWTGRHAEMVPEDSEWIRPRIYEKEFVAGKSQGRGAVIAGVLRLFELHLVASLRIYGFLLLGLVLMGWRLRQPAADGSLDRDRLRAWFGFALVAFLTGYAIVFGLELGGRSVMGSFGYVKWWLTRFLVPACILCLTGLVLAVAPPEGTSTSWSRRLAWGLMLVGGCFGPMLEFSGAFCKNWIQYAAIDPLPHRLNLLANVSGSTWAGNPFLK